MMSQIKSFLKEYDNGSTVEQVAAGIKEPVDMVTMALEQLVSSGKVEKEEQRGCGSCGSCSGDHGPGHEHGSYVFYRWK